MNETNLQQPYFHTHTSVDQKIKARACALMLKNGSPKFREVLREVKSLVSQSNNYLTRQTF